MKFESSATAVSWIPFEAVKGFLALPFDMGLAHYDEPLPARLDDLDEWHRRDLFRECNELKGWIEVEDGKITAWGQHGGGRIGVTRLKIGPKTLTVKAKADKADFEMQIEETQDFDGKAPYALRGGTLLQISNQGKQTVTLTRTPKGFLATTNVKGVITKQEIDKIDFTLADSMTASVWFSQKPKKGDKITTKSFDFNKLKTDIEHFTVLNIRDSKAMGVTISM